MSTPAPLTTFNFADIWDYVAATVPDREAVICGVQRSTFAELDAAANRLARHFSSVGIGAGDPIGVFSSNCVEWLETLIAAWKVRAVPFNINHRYLTTELESLLDSADAVGLVFDQALAPVVAGLSDHRRSRLRSMLGVDVRDSDGLVERCELPLGARRYDDALAEHAPETIEVEGRSSDDQYLLFTGGTTGHPKGVLWRQEDAFFACFGGGDPMRMSTVSSPAEIPDHIADYQVTFLCVPPLMHASGQWVAMSWLWAGSKVVLLPGSFDPVRLWDTVAAESANFFTVIGDAVAKPVLEAWNANPGRWDVSSLMSISNGGAPISATLKAKIAAAFPALYIVDGFGSSETGAQGSQRLEADGTSTAERTSGVARFVPYGDDTAVLGDDLERVAPGSGVVGRVALRGHIPIGYLHDEAKTAESFVEHGGDRWVLTGDFASVDQDGTISLLGRGSQCINTGGEKVFSEEVELALHGHPDVIDVLVVGVEDDRWGQAVCAVVQARPGSEPDLDTLRDHVRVTLAGYKLPKKLVLVDEVLRSPAGKADYQWASKRASQ